MKRLKIETKYLSYLLIFCMILVFACKNRAPVQADVQPSYDLPQIIEKGELVALTMYSSTSYFNYRGQEMGFQYELAEQFAESLGVKLRIEVAASIPELIQKLHSGKGDIITYPLPVTRKLRDTLSFCGKERVSHQVIVQRNNKKELLTDVTELIGKDIHVKQGKYYDRLVNLNQELGGGINIHLVEYDSISIEDLITQVSKGQIKYTVSDNDVALLNKTYYPNLNVNLQIGYDQRSSWAVRKDCPLLAEVANNWYDDNQTSPAYTASAKRYFEISKSVPHTSILSLADGKISIFDDLFKKYSKEIGWDWRLLASLAYTESNFDTTVVSWAGARGLMQLMPATARAMGIEDGMEHNAEESIKGAVRYIAETSRSLRMIEDKEEQVNFVLAAYNAGIGHVYDAMALAGKYGDDKYIWFNSAEKYILLKSQEEYFTDSVCRNGYFRGVETYNFVRDINSRFNTYKSKIKE